MKKVLVTEAERRRIAAEGSIQLGGKVTQKVIDLDKVVGWLREERKNKNLSPFIEIIPVSEDQYKNPHKQASYQKDPLTGVLYGIAIGVDDFGNIRWQKIQINEMLSLNLDNENDAKIWVVLRFNPDILGSPFQRETPYYKVYDPVDEALAEQAEIIAMETAFTRVRSITKDAKGMVRFARFLGEEVRDNTNFDIVHGSLLKRARYNSADFNKKWETRARGYAENFYSAHALGIITEDANAGFTYRNIGLGMTAAEAIKFLSKDSNVMNSIISELDEKDQAVISVARSISMIENEGKKEKKGNAKEEKTETADADFE